MLDCPTASSQTSPNTCLGPNLHSPTSTRVDTRVAVGPTATRVSVRRRLPALVYSTRVLVQVCRVRSAHVWIHVGEFSDMLALTTWPGQEIKIGYMDPGVPLNDGVIKFQIVEGTTTQLESAVWPFAGGELGVLPTVFETGGAASKADTIIVEARAWKLDQLIEVLRVPDLKATGTVSGRFPIDLEGANIMIRDATLEADEAGGSLAYTGSMTETVKGQNQYADYAFDALRDLDYTVMRVGASGNLIGNIIVTANLLGRSDDVLGGAEFDFNISVDSNLSQLLRTASTATSKTFISEAYRLRDEQKALETP